MENENGSGNGEVVGEGVGADEVGDDVGASVGASGGASVGAGVGAWYAAKSRSWIENTIFGSEESTVAENVPSFDVEGVKEKKFEAGSIVARYG